MTKDQKVSDVIAVVVDKRKNYTKTEFVQMVTMVWDGVEAIRAVATDNPPPTGSAS